VSRADDAAAVDAAKTLLRIHRAAGRPFTRLRSPDGAVLVLVDGEHASCLDQWVDEHTDRKTAHRTRIVDGEG